MWKGIPAAEKRATWDPRTGRPQAAPVFFANPHRIFFRCRNSILCRLQAHLLGQGPSDGQSVEARESARDCRSRHKRGPLRAEFGGFRAARIALETGMHSPWVRRLLSELGHQVIVAHARATCG